MSRGLPRGWLLLLCAAALACGPGPGSDAAEDALFEVRDSAGIPIAINATSALSRATVLATSDSPAVRIGAVEGAEHEQLYDVRGMRTLPDGSILILNAGTHQVRRYGADGSFLGSVGRRGAGPGEFRFPIMMLRGSADSTWIYDLDTRRFTSVDPHGTLARSRPTGWLSGLSALLDDSTALLSFPDMPRLRSGDEGWTEAQRIVAIAHIDGSAIDTLLQEPAPSFREYRYGMGELVRSVRAPFSVFPRTLPFNDGILVTDGVSADLRVLDRAGALRRIIRTGAVAQPLSAEMHAAWIDQYLASLEGGRGEGRLQPGEAARRRRILEEMDKPTHLPVFDAAFADSTHAWLRLTGAPGAAEVRWLAFDRDGRLAFVAMLPATFRVMEISASHALGLQHDDDGVEYAVRYDLRPVTPPGDGSGSGSGR